MIIVQTPLRVSLLGGNTDFPQYFKKYGGAVLTTTIDKYLYCIVKERFDDLICVNYSIKEKVTNVKDIKHELVREAMKMTRVTKGIEITFLSDIPSEGSGLGSSSAVTVGVLNALHQYKGESVTARQLAEEACKIEVDILKKPIGYQDQYAVAFGGTNLIEFSKKIKIQPRSISYLNNSLMLFYTGITRKSEDILSKMKLNKKILDRNKELVYEASNLNNPGVFGNLLDEYWHFKIQLNKSVTTNLIDTLYKTALEAGALGGKICFVPETQIKTTTGFKYIKEISKGEEVYGFKNEIQRVEKIVKRKYEGEVIEFKVTGLNNPIKSTPEHPFFTTIKSPYKERTLNEKTGKRNAIVNLPLFKEAKEFKKGDFFLIPIDTEIIDIKKIELGRKVRQSKYSKYNIYENMPELIDVDFDLLNTLGWYVAEGSANKKQVQFTLGRKELDDARTIEGSIKKIFKKISKVTIKGNSAVVVVTSKVLCYFFNDMCGKYAENKKIPEFIMKLPEEKQAIFFRALWKGDGCSRLSFDKRTKKSYRRCSFKTVSFNLVKQVQALCLRLGYVCHLGEEQQTPKVIYKNRKASVSQKAYTISVDGEDAIAFDNFLNSGELTRVKRSNKKKLSLSKELVKIDGTVYAKCSIREIKKTNYIGDVFNLIVGGSHTYITNGVAVHNCGAGGGGFLLLVVPPEKRDAVRKKLGLRELPFNLSRDGSKVIFNIKK